MADSDNDFEERRKRRSQVLLRQQHKQQRTTYGPRLASIVGNSVNSQLHLEDFSADYSAPAEFIWPTEIGLAPGLVRAYVGRQNAVSLLNCIGEALGPLHGHIGFHEKAYLGYAQVGGVRCCSLLEIAESAEESVLFYLNDLVGVILVDYYKSIAGQEYSVVVQGEELIPKVEHCFAAR